MPKDNSEILVNDPAPNVDVLLQEFKQAGVLPNGWYDIAFNQEKRRMIWAGQSPDGKRWDENMPEGQPALPWNGCSDTRVPVVDSVVNDDTALLKTAFWKAELRATAVDPAKAELASSLSAYLHWLVHTKFHRQLRLEVELSSQYRDEHGWAVAYVGWEREIGRRRVTVTLEDLAYLSQGQQANSQAPTGNSPNVQTDEGQEPAGEEASETPMQEGTEMGPDGAPNLMQRLQDPSQDDETAKTLQALYRVYVLQEMSGKGFYEDELDDERILDLKLSAAKRHVKELRAKGKTQLAMPYVCKNQPLVWVLQPYLEFLASRGTMMLQQSRALFWRRWMTEAELEAKKAEGWDADWIEEVKKTKGNIASWAGALGATSITGPSTKTVGNTTFLKVTEENNPLIEVLYAFVKKVDDDGVTSVWQTIFSPHVTRRPGNLDTKLDKEVDGNWRKKEAPSAQPDADFCALHEELDYAHGRYPFEEIKRENIGRALIDTRSVAEVAGTWQDEEKKQRDMLANRADWDTLPPVTVPKLGGIDYRLGPAAQLPISRAQAEQFKALDFKAPPATLSLELIKLLEMQRDKYFGQYNNELPPALIQIKQENSAGDFYVFWGAVLIQMVALTLQYNPQELVEVTGDQAMAQLDPFTVMDQLQVGMEFDVRELNPDYLKQKLDVMNSVVIPGDAAGVIDRAAYTQMQARMVDPRMARQILQDKGSAAQKVYDDTDLQMMRMATGNEAKYVENDPTAQMRLQAIQTIIKSNPKYQEWLQKDPRFQELLQNYLKNLQMSVEQEQNKTIGKIGVKPMTGAPVAPGTGQ